MTTIAPGSSAADTGAAEHAAHVRKAHDFNISRAEGWRRRGPLLPALIFVVINLAVDILYTIVDPRLRTSIRQPA